VIGMAIIIYRWQRKDQLVDRTEGRIDDLSTNVSRLEERVNGIIRTIDGFGEKSLEYRRFPIEEVVKFDKTVGQIVKDGSGVEKRTDRELHVSILPYVKRKKISALTIFPEKAWYDSYVLKEYLRELMRFDFFKYVVFLRNDHTFLGFMYAEDLISVLSDESYESKAIEYINSNKCYKLNDLSEKRYFEHRVFDDSPCKDVLKELETRGLDDIAVVDINMKFRGMVNKDDVVKDLMYTFFIYR
jgi:hypothetical protein